MQHVSLINPVSRKKLWIKHIIEQEACAVTLNTVVSDPSAHGVVMSPRLTFILQLCQALLHQSFPLDVLPQMKAFRLGGQVLI